MSTEETIPPADSAGISTETHNKVAGELAEAQRQLAILKAKTDVYDSQKREALSGMKEDVSGFINDIASAEEFSAFRHELAPMTRWCGSMETGDALDTNLSIGRLVSCASAKFKRTREEASQLGEKSTLLAQAHKELEELKADRDGKASRITELEGLVDERTTAAKAFESELAKHNLIHEKVDFSKRNARENTGAVGASSAPRANIEDALFAFMSSGPSNGGLKIGQSGTSHHLLGQTSNTDSFATAIAAQGRY